MKQNDSNFKLEHNGKWNTNSIYWFKRFWNSVEIETKLNILDLEHNGNWNYNDKSNFTFKMYLIELNIKKYSENPFETF